MFKYSQKTPLFPHLLYYYLIIHPNVILSLVLKMELKDKLSLKQISEVYDNIFKKTGIYMFLHGTPNTLKWKIIKIIHPLSVFVVLFVFALVHGFYIMKTERLAESMLNLGLIGNSLGIAIRMFSIVHHRKTFKSCFLQFETLYSNIHRKNSSQIELTNAYYICMKIHKGFKIVLAGTYSLWYITPLILSPDMLNFYAGNGIDYETFVENLPSSYTFKAESPYAELRFLLEIAMIIVTAIFWPSLYIIYFTMVYMLTVQYKILCGSVLNLESDSNGDDKKPMKIKYLVQDHVQLLRVAKGLKNILSPLLALLLLNSTILICCMQSSITSSAVITKGSNSVSIVIYYIKFVSFSSITLMELFLFSWFSFITDISNKKLAEALYESPWYKDLKKHQTDIIPPIIMSQRDLSFTALNLIPINLATYLDVCKFSYTYFTFMKGAREIEG